MNTNKLLLHKALSLSLLLLLLLLLLITWRETKSQVSTYVLPCLAISQLICVLDVRAWDCMYLSHYQGIHDHLPVAGMMIVP